MEMAIGWNGIDWNFTVIWWERDLASDFPFLYRKTFESHELSSAFVRELELRPNFIKIEKIEGKGRC